MKWNDLVGRKRGEQILVDPAHDRHKSIVAVLAVDGGGQQIYIASIVTECVEQALHTEGANAGMAGRDISAYRDLRGDVCEARFKPLDGRGIVALGKVGLYDCSLPQKRSQQIRSDLLELMGILEIG